MNKFLFSAIFFLSLLNSACNAPSGFDYVVVAKNGSENGFSVSNCLCNSATGKYMLHLYKPGEEKRTHCCFSDFSKDVQRVVMTCDDFADLGIKKRGEFESGNLIAEYNIQDKFNYTYHIHSR